MSRGLRIPAFSFGFLDVWDTSQIDHIRSIAKFNRAPGWVLLDSLLEGLSSYRDVIWAR